MKRGLRRINKKGSGHFEMIAAFVLFFTFVVFLLVYVKPYSTNTLQGSVVAGLHESFRAEAQTNFTKVFIKTKAVPEDCFSVNLSGKLFRFDFTESVVKDLSGIEEDSGLSGAGELSIMGTNDSYYVSISPEFSDEDVSCTELLEGYNLGSIDEKRVVSYTFLQNLNKKYESDYEGLKKELNFPEAYDFAIVSTTLPEIDMQGVVPEGGDIVAEEYLEEVLFPNGTIINQKFIIKVW